MVLAIGPEFGKLPLLFLLPVIGGIR